MNVLGIIFSYSDRANLRELTKKRTLASLPLGGKYRLIDYLLSNYVNSGIEDVSIITRNNYHSLMDHLGSGKEWDLTRKRGGLRVLTPYAGIMTEGQGIYRGTADALACHMHSIRRSIADYVIISESSFVFTMDFEELLKNHLKRNADITVLYTRSINGSKVVPLGVPILKMDENERIHDLMFNADDINPQDVCWSIGGLVIKKSLLESVIADAVAYQKYDLNEDIIKRLAPNLNIVGDEYKGYLMEVSTVAGYMKANMSLLDRDVSNTVYSKPIYTKIKDSVPALYCEGCSVVNSIVSDGCRIEGTVENSVLARGVKVGRGSVVRNSVIMQNTEILQNVSLNHAILDKDVIVRDNRELSGHVTYPVVVEKASII